MKKKVYFRSFFRSAGLLLMPLIFLFDGLHAENAWLPPTPDCGTAYWNMSNNGVVSTQSIPNLTVSGILHGNNNTNPTNLFPNATSSATTDYPTASGTFNASAAARSGAFSASNSTYFEITFTPASGRTFTINGLSFGSRSSGAGPTGISIRSDQDSYGSELAATTAPADQAWHFYSLNFTTPVTSQAGQPITLRIYGFGGTGTGPGTSTWRVDDLSIMGCTLLASTDCGDAYWSMASGATATSNNIPFVAFSGIVHGNNNGTVSNLFPNATSSSTTDYPTASGTFNANAAIVTGGFNAATSTYFEITVTPNAGKVFEFTGISFGSRSSGAGPQALSIRTNLNNYATEVAGNAAIAQNSTWAFYSFSGLSVSSLSGQPLIIRIYAYNGGGTQPGTSNWRVDDLTISGCANPGADCLGVIGGTALPGTSCDDGDAGTINDVYDANCNCAGVPPCDLMIVQALAANTGCPGAATGTVNVTATTSNGPITYTLSGPLNVFNYTGMFPGLPAGNYILSLSDGFQCTASQQVVVPAGIDNTPPSIVCSNQSITFNGQASIALSAAQLVSASDNCGVLSILLNPSAITCEQVGQSVPVTITVTDVNGNAATCTSYITVGGLPCGWSQAPNGVSCAQGSSISYNPALGVYTAISTNCFYGSPFTGDEMAYAQRQLCGNGSITALVTSINGTSQGWAGVVMRESSAAGAKKAQLMTNLSNFSRREFRIATNGQAFPQQFPSQSRYWLRIVRAGNQFTMYVSPNGTAWYIAGTQNIAMSSCIEMGLAVSNYVANSTVTATFSGVSFTGGNSGLGSPLTPEVSASLHSPLSPDFEVYPNPTGGELNLDLSSYFGRSVRIEVYSLEGKLMQFSEIDEVQMLVEQLHLSGLQKGMYMVKLKSPELPDAVRRIVKH